MNNLDWAKKRVQTLAGRNIILKVNKGRNKFITFNGMIESVYPSVFTVKTDDDTQVKSYSYSDVLTKTVRFFPDLNESENNSDSTKNINQIQ